MFVSAPLRVAIKKLAVQMWVFHSVTLEYLYNLVSKFFVSFLLT
jgi:hypothetical protein